MTQIMPWPHGIERATSRWAGLPVLPGGDHPALEGEHDRRAGDDHHPDPPDVGFPGHPEAGAAPAPGPVAPAIEPSAFIQRRSVSRETCANWVAAARAPGTHPPAAGLLVGKNEPRRRRGLLGVQRHLPLVRYRSSLPVV